MYVFGFLKTLILPESLEQAKGGEIMFCAAGIRSLFGPDTLESLHIIDPKKTKVKSIHEMVSLLWGFDDGRRRDCWADAPFRLLCRRAIELVSDVDGDEEGQLFHDLIFRYFVATHWLFPYHTPTKFVQRGRGKAILWTGFFHRLLADWEVDRMPIAAVSELLRTTIPQPTVWRPEADDRDNIPRRNQYMQDWDLLAGKKGPFMPQTPQDFLATICRFDASLVEITQKLEIEWRTWQQVEHPDQD